MFHAGTEGALQTQQSDGRALCAWMEEAFGGLQSCVGRGRAGGRGCFRKQLVLRGGGAQEKIAEIEKEMRRTQKNKV